VAGDEGWNGWLICLAIDPDVAGIDREAMRLALWRASIEARPVWKPMHLQPDFDAQTRCNVSEKAFGVGLCLPSGSFLTTLDAHSVYSRSILTIWPDAGRDRGRHLKAVACGSGQRKRGTVDARPRASKLPVNHAPLPPDALVALVGFPNRRIAQRQVAACAPRRRRCIDDPTVGVWLPDRLAWSTE
jgi:hypothetical protein